MRVRIMSDIHLEFGVLELPKTGSGADVVILAGDIGNGTKGIRWAARTFASARVLYVMGNHEPYTLNLQATLKGLREAAAKTRNVTFLENDEALVGGVRFLGATMWTDFGGTDVPAPKPNNFAAVIRAIQVAAMNDFQLVHFGRGKDRRLFTPEDSAELHAQSTRWLEQKLGEPFPGKTVVITHHAPHMRSIPERFKEDVLTPAFASDLSRLMGPPVSLWVHGHVHESVDYEVNGTRVVCNPRGYHPDELNAQFDRALVLEL